MRGGEKRRGSWRSETLSPVRVQVGRLSTHAKMGARPLKQLGNYIGHYAALGNNLRAVGRSALCLARRVTVVRNLWKNMSWSLHPPVWQCKRLASGGIELIKSLPSLMCFKRIYSILWHQTSRFHGRSFPFVSPPRMFELITAKLHTLGLLAQRETHTGKQQPVKAFRLSVRIFGPKLFNPQQLYDGTAGFPLRRGDAEAAGSSFTCTSQNGWFARTKAFSHGCVVLVVSHWFPVFCVARTHVG